MMLHHGTKREAVMKNYVFAILITSVSVTSAFAQSSLFDRYDVNMTKWAQLPADLPWGGLTTWVAADGKGTVIVMVRKAPYFRVFTSEGKFVKAWGEEGLFKEAHSVQFDREGFIWATDPNDHVVHKFSIDGKMLMTLGKKGVPGDNASRDTFNRPNAVAIASNGDIYVSDGYVNSRIVQFSKDGTFIKIIGGVKGNGPASSNCRTVSRLIRRAVCSFPTATTSGSPFSIKMESSSKTGRRRAAAISSLAVTIRFTSVT
jgi:NHL repeat